MRHWFTNRRRMNGTKRNVHRGRTVRRRLEDIEDGVVGSQRIHFVASKSLAKHSFKVLEVRSLTIHEGYAVSRKDRRKSLQQKLKKRCKQINTHLLSGMLRTRDSNWSTNLTPIVISRVMNVKDSTSAELPATKSSLQITRHKQPLIH